MKRLHVVWIAAFMALLASRSGGASETELAATLERAGYVSVPITRGADRGLYVKGKIHGESMSFLLDLTNDGALFDVRRLKKLGVELSPTELTIPTRRKTVQIKTAEILGLEFEGRSTPKITVLAGDTGAVYETRPGQERPAGALGTDFLKNLGAVLDFSTMQLHMKMR